MRAAICLSAGFLLAQVACMPVVAQVRTTQTTEASSTAANTAQARSQADETDRQIQQMWGLNAEEMRRAKVLAPGRGRISPSRSSRRWRSWAFTRA